MTVYTIYRVERDGTRTVVSCTSDAYEIGLIITEDRHDIDWEPQYEIVPDYGGSDHGEAEQRGEDPEAGSAD